VLVVIAAAALASCGGTEEAAETTESQDEKKTLTQQVLNRQESRIHGPMLDTLIVLKKRFGITRDEYWKNEGGVLANEYFEVWYPAGGVTVTHGMHVFEVFMPARDIIADLFGKSPEERLVVHVTTDLDTYKERTGREWWYYSEMKGDTITFSPLEILYRRGIAQRAIPHEYYQWAVGKITHHNAPRWLEEGIASYLVGEEELLINQAREFRRGDISMTPDKIEKVLAGEEDRRESRIAYFRAYFMVKTLVDTYGEDKLIETVRLMEKGRSRDEAFEAVYNKDYQGVLNDATNYTVDLSREEPEKLKDEHDGHGHP
jgi:hypothetical protein